MLRYIASWPDSIFNEFQATQLLDYQRTEYLLGSLSFPADQLNNTELITSLVIQH